MSFVELFNVKNLYPTTIPSFVQFNLFVRLTVYIEALITYYV